MSACSERSIRAPSHDEPRRRSDPRRRPDVVVAPGLPREHAILGQELYRVFADLRLSASLLDVDRPQANGEWSWYSIHEVFSVAAMSSCTERRSAGKRATCERWSAFAVMANSQS